MSASEKSLPQPMLPRGVGGRVFGVLMEVFAASNYRWTVEQLATFKPRTYLEVGFGTGKLAEMVARTIAPTVLCGVDPSPLMIEKATRRLRGFAKSTEVDLRSGDDTKLPWAEHSFDVIVASHSFQFWSNPAATFHKLRALIAPSGHLVLVIRKHASLRTSSWHPNPISRGGNELAGLRAALADAGFRVARDEKLRSGSQGIVAVCA